MRRNYVNQNVKHQDSQVPFVARAFYDDAALIGNGENETIIFMSRDELRDIYGAWLGRMRYLKEIRQSSTNPKRLNDDGGAL